MHLLNYIEKYYAGSQAAFARHVEVLPQQVTKWLSSNCQIHDFTLVTVKRKLPTLKSVFVCFVPNENNNNPLYTYYQSENRTERGGIELDIETGNISIVHLCDSPPEHYFGIWRRYEIHAGLCAQDIRKLIDDNIELFQAIQTGSEVFYDGNNWRGELNIDAQAAENKLSRKLYIDSFFDKYDENYYENIQQYDEECRRKV